MDRLELPERPTGVHGVTFGTKRTSTATTTSVHCRLHCRSSSTDLWTITVKRGKGTATTSTPPFHFPHTRFTPPLPPLIFSCRLSASKAGRRDLFLSTYRRMSVNRFFSFLLWTSRHQHAQTINNLAEWRRQRLLTPFAAVPRYQHNTTEDSQQVLPHCEWFGFTPLYATSIHQIMAVKIQKYTPDIISHTRSRMSAYIQDSSCAIPLMTNEQAICMIKLNKLVRDNDKQWAYSADQR